jgi:phosphatidylglycerophosphate synthase
MFGPLIDADGRQALLDYKYHSSWSSWLDLKVMNPFWEFVVLAVPMNIAPNTLTFMATLTFLWAFAFWQYYAPELNNECPPWIYFQLCIAMFIYQTLDAIDGKQARRTKSSSPLGQLFDHGNDAFIFTLMLTSALGSVGYDISWITFLVIKVGYVVFFLMNWRARHEGVMHHPPFGVTEAQFVGMGIFLITGVFGHAFWDSIQLPFAIGGVYLNLMHMVTIFMLVQGAIISVREFSGLRAWFAKTRNEDKGSNDELFHLFVWTLGTTLWAATGALFENPRMFIWIDNFIFSGLVHRLIVADVTHQRAEKMPLLIATMPFLALFSFSEKFLGTKLCPFEMTSGVVVYALLAWSVTFWVGYVTRVINEICDTCNIYLFSIEKPPKKKVR